jgi:hypothetical protein
MIMLARTNSSLMVSQLTNCFIVKLLGGIEEYLSEFKACTFGI